MVNVIAATLMDARFPLVLALVAVAFWGWSVIANMRIDAERERVAAMRALADSAERAARAFHDRAQAPVGRAREVALRAGDRISIELDWSASAAPTVPEPEPPSRPRRIADVHPYGFWFDAATGEILSEEESLNVVCAYAGDGTHDCYSQDGRPVQKVHARDLPHWYETGAAPDGPAKLRRAIALSGIPRVTEVPETARHAARQQSTRPIPELPLGTVVR